MEARLSAARNTFTKRRKAHFATLEEQREDVWMREVKLVVDAESLAALTAWGPTAGTFRDLMRPGRRPAGRVGRDAEEELWNLTYSAQPLSGQRLVHIKLLCGAPARPEIWRRPSHDFFSPLRILGRPRPSTAAAIGGLTWCTVADNDPSPLPKRR